MKETTRRSFFKLSGTALCSSLCLNAVQASAASSSAPLTLGMASYTFRKFKLKDCLSMTKRLGLGKIAFKSFHLPLDASDSEILAVVQKVKDAGLELYGGGVIYMKDEAQVHQAFHYAQTADMKVIIGVPNHDLLDLVEEKVKETDIYLAIHNHGPGDKLYPSPESAFEKVKNRDARMGLCIDIGHTMRISQDPTEEYKKFNERVFDIHIKDVTRATADGVTVEIGRGIIDIPNFLSTLSEHEYQGTVALEFEKDADDPLPGAAESIGYLKGVMAGLEWK